MPTLDELTGGSAGTPLANALGAGLRDISYNKSVVFTEYKRRVLPLDGFVFWVATGRTRDVPCSLHATTTSEVKESQSFDQSHIIISTQQKIHEFHDTALNTVWMGNFEGIKFAIGSRTARYEQSGLFHYGAATIIPALAAQFISNSMELREKEPVIGNSFPLFLWMLDHDSIALGWCPWPEPCPIFPSFCVPDNQAAPYCSIHVSPESATPLSMGRLDPSTASTDRLVTERVKLRFYGVRHQGVEDAMSHILHWCLLNENIMGIQSTPVIRDEKEPMAEINALAMAKTFELDVIYSQHAVRSTALALIRRTIPTVDTEEKV